MKYKVNYKNKMFIVDANSVSEAKDKVRLKDSDALAQLARKLAEKVSRLDRANFAHSRHLLASNDKQIINDVYKTGLQVKAQMIKEVDNINKNKTKDFARTFDQRHTNTFRLLTDATNNMYHFGDDKCLILAQQINDLMAKYQNAISGMQLYI